MILLLTIVAAIVARAGDCFKNLVLMQKKAPISWILRMISAEGTTGECISGVC